MTMIAIVRQRPISPTTIKPIHYLHGIAAPPPTHTAISPDTGSWLLSSIHDDRRWPQLNWTALVCTTTVIHSFIRSGGWPLAVFRRAFQPTASAEA